MSFYCVNLGLEIVIVIFLINREHEHDAAIQKMD